VSQASRITSIQPNECFLAMTINHKPVQALCDTGCAASCMSEEFASKLKLNILPSSDTVRLVSANQSPIENLGVVDVELCIQGLLIPFTICVLRQLSHNVILGCDFFRESGSYQLCHALYFIV
jgi:gag-polyprotein putative aspartyl protease